MKPHDMKWEDILGRYAKGGEDLTPDQIGLMTVHLVNCDECFGVWEYLSTLHCIPNEKDREEIDGLSCPVIGLITREPKWLREWKAFLILRRNFEDAGLIREMIKILIR